MSSDLHIAPANMVIILARTGAILGFAWCLARFAGFFIISCRAAMTSGSLKAAINSGSFNILLKSKFAGMPPGKPPGIAPVNPPGIPPGNPPGIPPVDPPP
uniref:Uncharacterized protein n=1 Tax=Opuntia streptacantha TaxID=393608 RepID=A0A7C8YS00_OPUST